MPENQKKKPWLSKTLWTNFLLATAALTVPSIQEWIKSHPEAMSAAFAGINMLLRWLTKDKLELR